MGCMGFASLVNVTSISASVNTVCHYHRHHHPCHYSALFGITHAEDLPLP